MVILDMTAFLPPNLIALFAPRDRIEFKAPIGELPHEKDRSKNPYSGIAQFVSEFDPHSETPAKVRFFASLHYDTMKLWRQKTVQREVFISRRLHRGTQIREGIKDKTFCL